MERFLSVDLSGWFQNRFDRRPPERGCSWAAGLVFCDGFVRPSWLNLGRQIFAPELPTKRPVETEPGSVLAAESLALERAPAGYPSWPRRLAEARFGRAPAPAAEPEIRTSD